MTERDFCYWLQGYLELTNRRRARKMVRLIMDAQLANFLPLDLSSKSGDK